MQVVAVWKGDGVSGAGVIVKGEMCEKTVEIRRVCAEADLWICSARWMKLGM